MSMLFDAIARCAERFPNRIAIEHHGTTTYRDLVRQSRTIAGRLLEVVGREPGPVAILTEHGAPTIKTLLGVWAAGKFAVPLDASATATTLRQQLVHAGPQAVVCDAHGSPRAAELREGVCPVVPIDEIHGPSERDVLMPGSDSDAGSPRVAAIVYTSGSTGVPKGVIHTHLGLMANVDVHTQLMSLTEQDRGLLLAKASTISGLTDSLRMLRNGGTVIPHNLSTGGLSELLPLLDRTQPTIVHFVPTVFRRLVLLIKSLGIEDRHRMLRQVRVVHLGGELVTHHDFELFRELFPDDCVLLHNLSCTEVPSYRQGIYDKSFQAPTGAMPVLKDAPGKVVELVDPDTGAVIHESGRSGEIVVRSAHMASGYWRDEPRTRERFSTTPAGESIYRTGDLGEWSAPGALIHLGRRDDEVKVLGRRICLNHVEAVLRGHPSVDEVAVVVVSSPQSSHLVAWCSGALLLEQTSLQSYARRELEAWEVPQFRIVEELPMLPGGKVDRPLLRKLSLTVAEDQIKVSSPPHTPMEIALAEIWRDVLAVDDLGRDANFFDLGGDSLQAVELLVAIRRVCGSDLSLAELFRMPTLQQLAAYLDTARRPAARTTYLEVFREGPAPILVLGYAETAHAIVNRLTGERGVVLLKIPGLHESPIRYWSIPDSIEAFREALSAADLEAPAAVVGYSYGGLLAYALAAELGASSRYSRLTMLIEPATPARVSSGGESRSPDTHGLRPVGLDGARHRSPSRGGIAGKFRHDGRQMFRKLARVRNWFYPVRYARLWLTNRLGGALSGNERWELFRPAMRVNKRVYRPPVYNGRVLLVGSPQFLNRRTPTWRALAGNGLETLAIGNVANHHAYTLSQHEAIWTQALFDRLAQLDDIADRIDVRSPQGRNTLNGDHALRRVIAS